MKARAGTGWQYVMTDLSLILFMITAAALRDAPPTLQPPAPLVPAEGEPVALWRGGAGTLPLRAWLDQTAHDPRLQLTVHAPISDAAHALALGRAAGRPARIVLDPQPGAATYAALTYDQGVARGLQAVVVSNPLPETLP